jgi:formylglycine-generating enzyme required for sulfatase activity
MRTGIFLLIFFPFFGFSQLGFSVKTANTKPENCVQIDSATFFGKTEISNAVYRQFVNFVRDSIITHLLYDSLPMYQAVKLLDVPSKQLKKLSSANRAENLKNYPLNYKAYKSLINLGDSTIDGILDRRIYLPRSLRYYKRKEIDTRKLVYRLNDTTAVAIYPDTLSWNLDYYQQYKHQLDTTKFITYPTIELVNLYFWHPMYDNYPVVGVNHEQIQAFCHWYEREINKRNFDPKIHYSVGIPTEEQYTQALQFCYPSYLKAVIGSQFVSEFYTYQRNFTDALLHIHEVSKNAVFYEDECPSNYKMEQWIKNNYTSPILNLLGGVAEVYTNPHFSNGMSFLGGDYYLGITDSNEIQANTLFYKRIMSTTKGYSYVGFRIIVKIRQH